MGIIMNSKFDKFIYEDIKFINDFKGKDGIRGS